ncbi:uncharacterized protein B0H18DRAFT_89910 [Fomitopsis serialis]|uniref:uncharacterized protein n=1 Tax=Fomitopsis serialis TaxID=139415 RepID=UPI0020076A3E|nr:uncharacterized protein B0H18DRAFT_89910 [Neoantrodia serialis]KAH9915668.1 hypothetical protein B0H18DRAFT_89910 [Neoantrodia serialis]
MRYTIALPIILSVVSLVAAFAVPIQDDDVYGSEAINWKKVGQDAETVGNTALKAISLGAKAYPLVKPFIREDRAAVPLSRRKVNWHKVGDAAYTASNEAIDVASTAVDVAKAIWRRAAELERLEAHANLAGSEAINWKQVGHVAGKVAGDAVSIGPLFFRDMELEELD